MMRDMKDNSSKKTQKADYPCDIFGSDGGPPKFKPVGLRRKNSEKDYGMLRGRVYSTCMVMPEKTGTRGLPQLMSDTKEYAETHYYGSKNGGNWKHQTSCSGFWVDFAEYCASKDPKSKDIFLSSSFIENSHNITEIVACLALLDLPYKSAEHGLKSSEGRSAELKAADNLIIFTKEIMESPAALTSDILLAQRYSSGSGAGSGIIEEFLTKRIYSCEVIMTNISAKRQEFDLLTQIPQGSLPVGKSLYQQTKSLILESYSTKKEEYFFYFPSPGKFEHFPANIAINSVVKSKANNATLTVVRLKTQICEENFKEIVSTGDIEKILRFLKNKSVKMMHECQISDTYFLLANYSFFKELVHLLKSQGAFEKVVWSYSLYHKKDEALISEYLSYNEGFKSQFGYYFDSKLIHVRPLDSGLRHLDYYPLINPRSHQMETPEDDTGAVGERPLILVKNFYEQYKKFIMYLIEKPSWDLCDKLNLSYYLLLQERIPESRKIFDSINEKTEVEGTLRMQYDYMGAYLDFYSGFPGFAKAREVAKKYANYPIPLWRNLFKDIDNQLREYDGLPGDIGKTEEGKSDKALLEKPIPYLSLSLEGKEILIDHANIPEISIKYYLIDLETLFSRAPFLTQQTDDFSFVKPNLVTSMKLDPKKKETRLKIHELYASKNAIIEVSGAGVQKMVTHFSTSLKVSIFENSGELCVADSNGKALSQVYVKVFGMRADGLSAYYKDGYTDIRGKFDYASLTAQKLAMMVKFAVFVMSDSHGSLIKECPPPPTITKKPEIEPVYEPELQHLRKMS